MDAEQEQLINAETPVLDIVFRHIYFLRISQTVISRLLGRYDLTDRKKIQSPFTNLFHAGPKYNHSSLLTFPIRNSINSHL